jgi:hypothetical protein
MARSLRSLALDLRGLTKMRAEITAQTVRTRRPAEKPYEVVDTFLKGFLLRVQPSIVMTDYFSYRDVHGPRARYRRGTHGSISPNQAHDETLMRSARVIAGENVQASKKEELKQGKFVNRRTIGGFLEHQYTPWVLAEPKTRQGKTRSTILRSQSHT